MIVRIYYLLFEGDNGWKLALWFSVVLNVNLAILNMLPIPVLDGGHIVLAMIEGVRRKPVNMKILEWVQTACATVIIGYMLYISFFDIGDLLGKNGDQKSPRRIARASRRRRLRRASGCSAHIRDDHHLAFFGRRRSAEPARPHQSTGRELWQCAASESYIS